MTGRDHETGTIRSGDVTLFFRRFGRPGAMPIVILHGANYYDSADWIEVAGALATDREVIAFDTRGFGESGWSPSKDYSHDALMADIAAVLDHAGWRRAVIMGHSMGGGNACLFAARFAARSAALILVDHCPVSGPREPVQPKQVIGNKARVFAGIAEAQQEMSREKTISPGSAAAARLETLFRAVEGGFVFRRDPDYANRVPTAPAGWTPSILVGDMWDELARVDAPILIVRGTRSDRYKPETIDRVRTAYPRIVMVDVESGHDVAGAAPRALIDAVRSFVARTVDARR